jgi:hypothetical protein
VTALLERLLHRLHARVGRLRGFARGLLLAALLGHALAPLQVTAVVHH